MKTRRKTILKWLRKISESIPKEDYKAYHKYHEPQLEEAEDGKMVWRMGFLGTHPVSHYRRMKTLYDRIGMRGVENYLLSKGLKLVDKKS